MNEMEQETQEPGRRRSGGRARVMEVPMQLWRKYSVLLLWLAVGLDLIVSKLGFCYLGQSISILFVVLYLIDNVSLRRAVCSFWFGMMDLYFREISVGGEQKILPIQDGRAVIFACAPHVNQFVDPIVVMKVVALKTRRHISWMTAAKSFARPAIGKFARALKGIPVVRPEDNEERGSGFITTQGCQVRGHGGTQFTRSFKKGCVLVVKRKGSKLSGKVAEVISDEEMVLSSPMQETVKTLQPSDNSKAFHRALSTPTTLLLLLATLLPLLLLLPRVFPPNWWPMAYMLACQLACLITSLIYKVLRDESKPEELIRVVAPLKGLLKVASSGRLSSLARHEPKKKGLQTSLRAAGDEATQQGVSKRSVDVTEPSAYSFLPYVDQSEMFEQVYDFLLHGGTIGIFPEGGTHDGTQLLPLKWGISTMVLGAMAKHTGPEPLKISVVPVGLNYFSPHQFRSTVSVDFGDPIDVDQATVDRWRSGSKEAKQEANAAVMDLVMAGVSAVTLQAKDVETLELYRTIRRLFVPLGSRLSVKDNVALTQSVAASLNFETRKEPRVQHFLSRCRQYSDMLTQYKVHDYQVQRFRERALSDSQRLSVIMKTLHRLSMALLLVALLLPWWLCVAPVSLCIAVVSDWQARKANKMSVKGTWKILAGTAVIPLTHFLCTCAFWFTFGEFVGLVWFFTAPVGGMLAIYATEESFQLLKSLNSLLFVLANKNAGEQLYNLRESLRKEALELMPSCIGAPEGRE
uniref:Phospholipid/glycerol acyltransferase domain-containing protein n=1 Tax=Guillardia theta TaxID=55529 RepID=A0A7S4KUF0_GUITH|mmetsp:Transcript_31086/g.99768  ORF Transcript_31086/g.99768 Transcript_31086/m.99768 type:complete len:747 (+) Transcript_31086:71-2311(+)